MLKFLELSHVELKYFYVAFIKFCLICISFTNLKERSTSHRLIMNSGHWSVSIIYGFAILCYLQCNKHHTYVMNRFSSCTISVFYYLYRVLTKKVLLHLWWHSTNAVLCLMLGHLYLRSLLHIRVLLHRVLAKRAL